MTASRSESEPKGLGQPPISHMIVDFHTHIFPPWLKDRRDRYVDRDRTLGELYRDSNAKMADVDDLIAVMDEDGVDVAVVMGMGWTDIELARDTNDYLIDSVRNHSGRLVGFAGVNPAWGAAAAQEAARCADAGLRGVGELHPDTQGYDIGEAGVMAPLMEAAQELGLVLTTHSSEPVGHLYPGKGSVRPESLWKLALNYPDAVIVMAHWGGGLPFYALMPEVKESLRNVYFDTAASPYLYTKDVFTVAASLVGAEHILLGSDFGLMRPGRLLKQARESGLSDAELAAVTGGNAARLLGLQGEGV